MLVTSLMAYKLTQTPYHFNQCVKYRLSCYKVGVICIMVSKMVEDYTYSLLVLSTVHIHVYITGRLSKMWCFYRSQNSICEEATK